MSTREPNESLKGDESSLSLKGLASWHERLATDRGSEGIGGRCGI